MTALARALSRMSITSLVMIVLCSCGTTQSTQAVATAAPVTTAPQQSSSTQATPCTASVPAQTPQPADAQAQPPIVQRGARSPNHTFLDPLVGAWNGEMKLFIAGGTAEKPLVSTDIVACKQWIAGERFLQDITQGTVDGSPYYRMGLLGYNTMDKRYEWDTVDGLNANMMFYAGTSSATNNTIDVNGAFTDQGVLGEDTVGKRITMRTVFHIESHDRHVQQLFFTPPNDKEFLAAEMTFTRQR